MSFETGYAANEFELQEKLNAFIMSIDGWTKVSQIDTFDSVYFSSGEDGYKDIYIRIVAGLTEDPAPYGLSQKDLGDGYTGYVNFFVYQYFPDDGDGYDGYGQAGQYGPYLYWFNGENEYDLYHNRIMSDNNWKFVNHIANTNSPDEQQDIFEWYDGALNECDAEFDGKRYWYYWTNSSGFLRFDIASESADILWQSLSGQTIFSGLQYWVDPETRKEYVWYMKGDRYSSANMSNGEADPSIIASELKRWNVEEGVAQFGFSGPEWSGDRDFNYGSLIIGHNNLYCFRGNGYAEWAKYHIPSDTWVNLDDMPENFYMNDGVMWLDKKISEFNYHRIYWSSQNDQIIYYINIDENSGMPIGNWTSAGNVPVASTRGPKVFHNNRNRFFYHPGIGPNVRKLYYSDITSGILSWTGHNGGADYLPNISASNSTFTYMDGYLSKVKVSLEDRTQYWFIGNKDRILIVTKTDNEYNYCYAGTFSQYSPSVPHALTTADIYAGSSVEVPINVLKGEFEVGQRMFIADVTDRGGGWYKGELENIPRLFKAMEMFEISDVNPGISITISSLKNNYPSGSRIAYDPQPVGVTLGDLDRVQMLNCINTVNTIGSIDMAENIAKLQTVSDEIVNASGGASRRNTYALWPINIVNSDTDAASSGTEARGCLIGVFAVSNTGDLSSEDTIAVGSNSYMIFDVPGSSSFLYAFGPLT